MLKQDPYFIIFAQEDHNSKLLINLVHLSPVTDMKATIKVDQWAEVSQVQQRNQNNNKLFYMIDSNLLIIQNS